MRTTRTRIAPIAVEADSPAPVTKRRARPAQPNPELAEALAIIAEVAAPSLERRSRTRRIPEPVEVVEPEEEANKSFVGRVDYDSIIKSHTAKATTPKKAIRAKCIECMGGLIAEVRRCTSTGCPLYPYRLGQNPFHKLSKHNKDPESEDNSDE